MAGIVIVGSGLGGYTVARELRKLDSQSALTVITADDGRFYSKPMLSNALAQKRLPDQLATHSAVQMASQLSAEVQADTRVTAINPRAKTLVTDKSSISYDKLVLAIGAHQRKPALQGDGADAVLTVNDLADYGAFRAGLAGARSITIIGAGLIGCEFANDLLGAGYQVHIVAHADEPLDRLVPAEIGAGLREALAKQGAVWHRRSSATTVDRTDGGLAVTLASGERITSDLVLSATGLAPNLAMAQAAGLTARTGIVVDRLLQTSAADIYAVGDCAEVEGLSLPFVMPIMNQARALAKTLAGQPTHVAYPVMPVVVKTPAYPVVVVPPPRGSAGQWQVETRADGVKARFLAPTGQLIGFALGGSATGEKANLIKETPSLLP